MDNQAARVELKTKATDYLMANCIDIVKECAYQPWDEATEKRVQNWIDIVATMNDPKIVSASDASINTDTTVVPSESFVVDPFSSFGSEEEPF